jgi:hypothetical protein
MLKKTQLSEKLKKLKIEGATREKPVQAESHKHTPESQASDVADEVSSVAKPTYRKNVGVKETKAARVEAEADQAQKQILIPKIAAEIDEKKPEEIIEPLIQENQKLTFISDLAIPAPKLSKLFKIETSYTEVALTQILTAWKDSEKIIKWTAKLDKHGQEFYSLKGEGLMKMKDNPPVYGMEFDDGAIISTYIGEYTFIMGCYNFDVKTLVKIFAYGIENAKRFNL